MIQDFSHQNKEWENPVFIKKPEKRQLAKTREMSLSHVKVSEWTCHTVLQEKF
jgi:hypothetical protein